MSLDITFTALRPTEVFSANITHNLGKMASECGLYEPLWGPEKGTRAWALVAPLIAGIERLKSDPARFKQFNPANGWGDYDTLLKFAEETLTACKENPDAEVSVWK